MKILWVLVIAILAYIIFCIIKKEKQHAKLKSYIEQWQGQLNLFGTQQDIEEESVFTELKNVPIDKLTAGLVLENIFSDYKLYLLTQARREAPEYEQEVFIDYLKTITLKEFIDCTIPTGDDFIQEAIDYKNRVTNMKEINMDKLCGYLSKHPQTEYDLEVASRVVDQLEPYIMSDKEITDEEAALIVDRWAKEKALRKTFDEFCANNPVCQQHFFKKENFWTEIKRNLYRIDSKGLQYRDIDYILSSPEWWKTELQRYVNRRRTESFREDEEFQRLKRETARIEREARQIMPRKRFF